MKLKKLFSIIFVFVLLLFACSETVSATPTSLKVDSNEINLIIYSERDLNDIVTFRFEPKNVLNRDITWSSEEGEVFELDNSIIKTKKIGSGVVKATSVSNSELSVEITINVINPGINYHKVTANNIEGINVTGLKEVYEEGEEVAFSVDAIDNNKKIISVKANDNILESNDNNYIFIMPNEDVIIDVEILTIKKATNVILDKTSLELSVGQQEQIISATVEPIDTTDIPTWTITLGENIISINPNGNKVSVKALNAGKATIKVTYNELVFSECQIEVTKQDFVTNYHIEYDLGTGTQSKKIKTNEELYNTFIKGSDGTGIISSVTAFDLIYGAGYGGKDETKWVDENMLKFGTQNAMGYLILNLNTKVTGVKITGYVNFTTCEVRIGDSESVDWTDGNDNKTSVHTCSDMPIVSKEVVEGKQVGTFTINFDATNSLRIGTQKKGPLYITAIEFIC